MYTPLDTKIISKIKKMGKKPGEYTKEELYNIGVAHKDLNHGKNWIELAKLLGLEMTGEQYRKWILHQRYKKNAVPKNPKVLSDKTIDEVSAEDASISLVQQRQDLIKERMRVRDERTSLNKTLREEARIERFVQTVKDVAREYKDLPPVIVKQKVTTKMECEAVYGLADLHLGPELTNYINTYNMEEAAERINKLAQDIIYYCVLNNVTTLHCLNLGDLIAGIIHPTIRLEQEYDAITQVMRAAELVSQLVYTLKTKIPEVTYRSVVDNHARLMPDKNQHIELENLNRIIDVFV